jgi:hypothetical protein
VNVAHKFSKELFGFPAKANNILRSFSKGASNLLCRRFNF